MFEAKPDGVNNSRWNDGDVVIQSITEEQAAGIVAEMNVMS